MGLAKEDIEQIQQLIREELQNEPANQANVRYEIDLRERMIRVEEELKHQRELMLEGFKQSDKRFEEIQHTMDKRFEQVDKRFEQVDKRFEQFDKRFDEMGRRMDRFMFWSFGITISVGFFVVNYLK